MKKKSLLEQFIQNTWDGDVSFNEGIQGRSPEELRDAEVFLSQYPKYVDGIPFPGDDKEFDKLSDTNRGAQALQAIVDNNE